VALAYILIFGFVILLGMTVVAGFVWAARTGQFHDFQRGATSIFDADEPVGRPTDHFPGGPPGKVTPTDESA
jgi:cbb3-type cytochrome oxidase maturation protein